MSRKPTPPSTVVSADGLRYEKKAGGSFYGSSGGAGTMSCFRCGRHQPRDLLVAQRILGRRELVCKEDCREKPSAPAEAL